MREVVVEDERGNRRKEPGRGSDERLADPRRHDCQVCRAGCADALKRNHDSNHGAEEPDERRHTRGGGQKRHATLELGDLVGGRTDERAVDAVKALQCWTRGRSTWIGTRRLARMTGRTELRV